MSEQVESEQVESEQVEIKGREAQMDFKAFRERVIGGALHVSGGNALEDLIGAVAMAWERAGGQIATEEDGARTFYLLDEAPHLQEPRRANMATLTTGEEDHTILHFVLISEVILSEEEAEAEAALGFGCALGEVGPIYDEDEAGELIDTGERGVLFQRREHFRDASSAGLALAKALGVTCPAESFRCDLLAEEP